MSLVIVYFMQVQAFHMCYCHRLMHLEQIEEYRMNTGISTNCELLRDSRHIKRKTSVDTMVSSKRLGQSMQMIISNSLPGYSHQCSLVFVPNVNKGISPLLMWDLLKHHSTTPCEPLHITWCLVLFVHGLCAQLDTYISPLYCAPIIILFLF